MNKILVDLISTSVELIAKTEALMRVEESGEVQECLAEGVMAAARVLNVASAEPELRGGMLRYLKSKEKGLGADRLAELGGAHTADLPVYLSFGPRAMSLEHLAEWVMLVAQED